MAHDPEWPLLAPLDPDDRRAFLAACGRPHRFNAGERLVHRDAPARGLFLVRSGHAAVTVSADVGHEQIVNILGPGHCFGELGLIDGAPRSVSVDALDECEVYFMSRVDFDTFRRERREVDEALLRHLARLVRALTGRLADANRPARVRVVRSLMHTADAFGARHRDGIVPISHATLATVTGVGETTVQYELGRLRRSGLIDQERRQIRLVDPDGLTAIAEDERGSGIG